MSNFAKSGNRPRLQSLDELFSIDNEENPANNAVNTITNLEIGSLVPFHGHPFKLYDGERLEDMIESIRKNGVLSPILVRKKEAMYEILAGHNRTNAAKLAGLTYVPAIVLENLSDEEAKIYVIETNLMQRSFTDMTHTEKAAVIALHHSKLFSQGKRNDILEKLQALESPMEDSHETSSQVANKSTSIERVGETYSLSKDTVARYLRVNKLIAPLKERLDKGEFAFIPAVTLSFLPEDKQEAVNDCIERNALVINMAKAETLRNYSDEGNLNGENIYKILLGETAPKTNRTPSVKIDRDIYSKYFTSEQSSQEIQDITQKALELYFESKQ